MWQSGPDKASKNTDAWGGSDAQIRKAQSFITTLSRTLKMRDTEK